MRIPGIVDVYRVGEDWIARSWPRVQNQPNSAAQLYWRAKFRDAHALIKTWTGVYMKSWRAIHCPPGKMWLDVAMTSVMTFPGGFTRIPTQQNMKYELYFSASPPPDWEAGYCLFRNHNARMYFADGPGYSQFDGAKWKEAMRWDDLGWICAAGKRPKKRWGLSYDAKSVSSVGSGSGWINGQFCDWYFFENIVTGIFAAKLLRWPKTETEELKWALQLPPVYAPVKLWPGQFIP